MMECSTFSATATRRTMLGALVLGTAAAAMAGMPRRFFGPGGEPIGLQVYTLGTEMLKDLDATFAAVAGIGYRTVELLTLADHSPAEIRDALKRAGLVAHSTQTSFKTNSGPNLTTGLDEQIAAAHTIGLEWVVPSLFDVPERLGPPRAGEDLGAWFVRLAAEMTADDWKHYADTLNKTGAVLKRAGIGIAHHNHNLEFNRVGDTTGFDLLLAHTDPSLVAFEIDVGWVAAAGHDPVAILDAHPGRFRMIHMKDIAPETVPNYAFKQVPAVPGQGVLDWKTLLPAAKKVGITGWYVEEEAPFPTTRLDAARANYAYLSTLTV
jgi:sugar phosphate isomerase/epimerase